MTKLYHAIFRGGPQDGHRMTLSAPVPSVSFPARIEPMLVDSPPLEASMKENIYSLSKMLYPNLYYDWRP